MLCAFFCVVPRRLKFICRRFGTLRVFHLHRQVCMEMEETECSETPAYKIKTSEKYTEESLQHLYRHFVLIGHLGDIEASDFKIIFCLLLCHKHTFDNPAISESKYRKYRIIGRKYVLFSTLKLRELYHKFNNKTLLISGWVAQSIY